MATQESVFAAALAQGVQEAMKNIPAFCQTEAARAKVVETETPLAREKATAIWGAWSWVPYGRTEDLMQMDVARSSECKALVERAWVSCWEDLPQVAKDHLVMAEVKQEWFEKECLARVKECVSQPPAFHFEPEVPPSKEDEHLLGYMDASLEKELEQALGEKCAAVETSVPEYLRSAEMGRKIRQEHYWPLLRDVLHRAGHASKVSPAAEATMSSQTSEGSNGGADKQDGMTAKKIVIVMLRVGLFCDC